MATARRAQNQGGIVQELLKTPVFKDILRNGLRSLRHKDGGNMVKTVMGQDPEVFLGLAVTLPAILNILVRSIAELGRQLNAQYAPGILTAFLESLMREIDTDSLKECGAQWKDLVSSLWTASPEARQELLDAVLNQGPEIGARGIDILSRAINDLERKSPGSASAFLSELMARTDKPEWSRATQTLAGALLDQKWHVFSWSWRLVTGRVRKRMGRKG